MLGRTTKATHHIGCQVDICMTLMKFISSARRNQAHCMVIELDADFAANSLWTGQRKNLIFLLFTLPDQNHIVPFFQYIRLRLIKMAFGIKYETLLMSNKWWHIHLWSMHSKNTKYMQFTIHIVNYSIFKRNNWTFWMMISLLSLSMNEYGRWHSGWERMIVW